MFVLVFLLATTFLFWQIANLRLTDPMHLGLNRAWFIWLSVVLIAICLGWYFHEVWEYYQHGQVFYRIGLRINGEAEVKSESEFFMEAMRHVAFGDPIRF